MDTWKDQFQGPAIGRHHENSFARWYDMDVVYENEATKELRFGCYVNRYNEITPLVKLLEQTGRVTVTVEGKTIKIFTNH